MINYTRLGYEIKRDFTNFSLKISKGVTFHGMGKTRKSM